MGELDELYEDYLADILGGGKEPPSEAAPAFRTKVGSKDWDDFIASPQWKELTGLVSSWVELDRDSLEEPTGREETIRGRISAARQLLSIPARLHAQAKQLEEDND